MPNEHMGRILQAHNVINVRNAGLVLTDNDPTFNQHWLVVSCVVGDHGFYTAKLCHVQTSCVGW